MVKKNKKKFFNNNNRLGEDGFVISKKALLFSIIVMPTVAFFGFVSYQIWILMLHLNRELVFLTQKVSLLEEQLAAQALELKIAQEAARSFELKLVKPATIASPPAYALSDDVVMLLIQCAMALLLLGIAGGLTYWGVASLKHAFASTFLGKFLGGINALGLKLVSFGSSGGGDIVTKTFADTFGNQILVETLKSTSSFAIKIKPAESSCFVDLASYLLSHREVLDSCAVSVLTMQDDASVAAAGVAAMDVAMTTAESIAEYLKYFPLST